MHDYPNVKFLNEIQLDDGSYVRKDLPIRQIKEKRI